VTEAVRRAPAVHGSDWQQANSSICALQICALRTRTTPVLRHQPSHSCTVCAECFAASAALHRATPNVQFSESLSGAAPVEKPSGARRSRLESYGTRSAPRVSRQATRAAARFHGTLLTCASVAASFGLHCDAMLRAGHAPVGYRGVRVGSSCVERHVVSSLGAPARAWRLQPLLGFRCALWRCSLRVPVPYLALRARRDSVAGASLRVRCQAKRSAEVRLALFSSVLSSHAGLWCCRRRWLARQSRCG
jgi:hypothetical protein